MMVSVQSSLLLVCLSIGAIAIAVVSSNSCTSDRDCQPDKTFQACRGGICKCSSVSYFNPKYNICQITVRGSCALATSKAQSCVNNGHCFSKIKGAMWGRCECNKNYEEDVYGLCNTATSFSSSLGITLMSLLIVPFVFRYSIS